MPKIFLSYAHEDGAEFAARLRSQLERAGFAVWRDIEEMRGSRPWKNQLRQALRQVDALVVVLTPGATRSNNVTWEWESGLTLEKPIITLLLLPCLIPDQLKQLHYHDFSKLDELTDAFAALVRDLRELESLSLLNEDSGQDPPMATYTIKHAEASSIGHGAITINYPSGTTGGAEAVTAILRHFELSERRIVAQIITRLDEQDHLLLNHILEAIENNVIPGEHMAELLGRLHAALASVPAQGATANPLMENEAEQLSDIIDDPSLEMKHKLKLTVPIIPVFLSYEGEMEVGIRASIKTALESLFSLIKKRETDERERS